MTRGFVRCAAAAALTLVMSFGAISARGAETSLSDASRSAICGSRATCSIAAVYPAGRTSKNASINVVELRLGLADRPADSPDEGCRSGGEARDGGQEFWLIETGAAPRRLLALCNDGYGAAMVGDDEVDVGNNRLIHTQFGGSAWRWQTSSTLRLSPLALLRERSCSYHTLTAGSGVATELDLATLTARSVARIGAAPERGDLALGCPDWPARFVPEPGPHIAAGYNLVQLARDGAESPATPRGSTIGDCGLALSTDGKRGFLVHGTPAAAERAAEIRAVAESARTLLVQIRDPLAARRPARDGSWVHAPHIELWSAPGGSLDGNAPDGERLQQIGVGLDGAVHDGSGAAPVRPTVEHWTAKDERRRSVVVMRLTWPDEDALAAGIALVYSQAEAGKQTRRVATSGFEQNRPLYLPRLVSLPHSDETLEQVRCTLRDGRLAIERKS